MGLGKTLGITIFIIAVIFVGVYLFYNNQQQPITIISSQQAAQNKIYQDFKSYVSNVTGIPIKNITNMTSFPDMINDVIERDSIYSTKYPYQNTYVYPSTSFTLIFPNNALLFNITNNSIADIIFVVETQNQINNINSYNLTYQESLPRITIPYYISKNNLTYTFKIYNPNNYDENITITEIPINAYIIRTLGIEYQGNIHLILYN
ncbi:MAG: hypothetical protein QW528_03595 [Candidatus Micrarchaeaceae archaeon]